MTRSAWFFLVVLLALPVGGASAVAQQATSGRQPPAFLGATLSLQGPHAGSVKGQLVALRGSLEVPIRRFARPWVAAGYWGVAGRGCTDFCPAAPQGATFEAGVDAGRPVLRSRVLPFIGAGAGLRFSDNGDRALRPVLRVGADLQLWPWLAPRVQAEWTSFPDQGTILLLGAGLRVGLPLR